MMVNRNGNFVNNNKFWTKICSPVASVEKRWKRREGRLKGWGFFYKKLHISRICQKIWWNHRFQPGSTHVLGDRTGRYTHTVGYSRLLLLWFFFFWGGQNEEDTHTLSDIPGEIPHILTIISYFFTVERCGPLAWSSCLSQLLEFSPSLSMCSSGDTLDVFLHANIFSPTSPIYSTVHLVQSGLIRQEVFGQMLQF